MKTKKTGTQFETECMEMLKGMGFWVGRLNPSADGSQPADLIAVWANKDAYQTHVALIDCKLLSGSSRFPFSRVEENQRMAHEYFEKNVPLGDYFFMFGHEDRITLAGATEIFNWEKEGKKSIDVKELCPAILLKEFYKDADEKYTDGLIKHIAKELG